MVSGVCFNSKKEYLINFTTTTNGLFEIIIPVMGGDELFDANLLEQTINGLISQGKRNFALDLSNIEYIYSDSINKFINLNHKVLNIYGRLSLLSPQEEVRQILQRAGIQNFITIHDSVEALAKASQEMILQTTTINVGDVQNQQPTQPQSEFDDLRSEIGNAINIDAPTSEPDTSTFVVNDGQDTAFGQQESVVEQQLGQPISQPPVQPSQSTQQPFQSQEQPVPPQEQPPVTPLDNFDQQSSDEFAQVKSPVSAPIPDFGGSDIADDRFEVAPKSGGIPTVVVILLVASFLVVAGVVGFMFMTKSKSKIAVKPNTQIEKISDTKSDLPELEDVPDMDDPVLSPKPVVKKTPKVTKKPRTTTRKKNTTKKNYTKPSKSIKKRPVKAAVSNDGGIVITSSPSGAKVLFHKKVLGVTPYTWKGSLPYGMIALTVVKDGYNAKNMNFEYTGDATKKNFVLTIKKKAKAVVPVAKPVATKRAVSAPVAKTTTAPKAVTPTPAVSAKPKGKPGTIFISSLPPMADVYMDGVKIGKTNIAELKVQTGTHEMKFIKGAKQVTKKMTFTPGHNNSQLIRLK